MLQRVIGRAKKINLGIYISFILFIIPFFWFGSHEIDIGGDGSRLYFYDPQAFINNVVLYSTAPESTGVVDPTKHAYLIYVSMIAFINFFSSSPTFVVSIFNSIKLSIGFLSIYFIVRELTSSGNQNRKLLYEIPAVLAGLFYILSTGSEMLSFFWVKALHSHDQIFLNPLIFLLLMRYLLTENSKYIFILLFLTFLFSTNFAVISSPPFFAFYPIALFFLFFYVLAIRKKNISIKKMLFYAVLFLGIHAFHLIPEVVNLFHPGSLSNTIVFKGAVNEGVSFFEALESHGLVSINLFLVPPAAFLKWVVVLFPLSVFLGLVLMQEKQKVFYLVSIFFFITLFLVSANVTHVGYEIYKLLFYIPGFSMFRHFFIQWAFVFIFFYSLLFGLSLVNLFRRIKKRYSFLLISIIILSLVIGYSQFLNGQLVNGINWTSNDVRTFMKMDPRYEDTLNFIKTLPGDGKILMLPLTDNFNQVLFGTNNAAYVGPSSISRLTDKKSFAGYQNFYPYPIPEDIMRLSREKNYEALTQIFSLFNIRYIFYNSDTKIYEEKFPQFPNNYMMTSMPKTQEEYKRFVKKFPVKLIYNNNTFQILEFEKSVYRPEIYIPDRIYKDEMIPFLSSKKISWRSAFIDGDVCKKNSYVTKFCNSVYNPPHMETKVKRTGRNEYEIYIKQEKSNSPFLLVFLNSFHTEWSVSFEGSRIPEEKHVQVNKYANAWIIEENDHNGKVDYTFRLSLATQKYFRYGVIATVFSLTLFSALVIKSLMPKNVHDKKN